MSIKITFKNAIPAQMPVCIQPEVKAPIIIDNDIIEVEAEEVKENNNFIGWEVMERPIYNKYGDEIEGFKQLVRSDNNYTLNVCNEKYKPTSNELFCDSVKFITDLTGLQLAKFEELKGGKILLAYLWNTKPVLICGHKVNSYMIIGNSHNYESTFFIGEHTSMIRCMNQFNQFRRDLKAYHTPGHEANVKRILTYYTMFKGLQQSTIDLMQRLEGVSIDQRIKRNLINNLLELKPTEDLGLLSKRKQNILQNLENSIERETFALGNNLFGLFNGVTHWTTHERNEKEKVYSQFFGSSAQLNNKALNFCSELLS